MSGTVWIPILISVFGSLVTIIQVLGLQVLGDIRSRVTRLEDHLMSGGKK